LRVLKNPSKRRAMKNDRRIRRKDNFYKRPDGGAGRVVTDSDRPTLRTNDHSMP
jgi:hypothetical protein